MKVVICGGHHNCALVVAEEFRSRGHQVYWLGHKHTTLDSQSFSAEYNEVVANQFPFYEIQAGKWQLNYRFWPYLFRFPRGFWQSWRHLSTLKPDLVLSFGGYLALSIAAVAWCLQIPVFTHEQTVVSGLANEVIGRFARKVFVSFLSSAEHFPRRKVVHTGLPLRPELLRGGRPLFANQRKTIYVSGGKQGSHLINELIFSVLPKLLPAFNVIHQCGSTARYHDYHRAGEVKKSLADQAVNYLVQEYFTKNEIGRVFSSADMVISRAGAHTTYELIALEKPAILIPIPWSRHQEQVKNARLIKSWGLAEVLSQEDLTSAVLLDRVRKFSQRLADYRLKPGKSLPTNAATRIVDEIERSWPPRR